MILPKPETLDVLVLGDLGLLESLITEMGGVSMVIIDPPACFMADASGKGVDGHSDIELRRILSPLGRLARKTGCAIILNTHVNKGAGKGISAQMRVIGWSPR